MARIFFIALLAAASLAAQKLDPVQWTLSAYPDPIRPGAEVPLRLTAKIDRGWHLYSLTTPQGGAEGSPIQTTVKLADNKAVDSISVFQPIPERKFDPGFGLDIETYSGEPVFWLLTKLKSDAP